MSTMRARVGVLISGRGSNLAALIEAAQAPSYPAAIALVISNRPDAAGLALAQSAGIPAMVVDHRAFEGKPAFEAELDRVLRAHDIEIVCLAGFMRLLSPWLVERWRDRMLNIHPSLLPSFQGLDTHARALEAGVRVHGCTVHLVREEVDCGPILAQAAVPIASADTQETLSARVLAAEHRLYPHALALLASGAVRIVDGRVEGPEGPVPPSLFVP
jgi:phosphoribosylglycinamide formyltransferase-1